MHGSGPEELNFDAHDLINTPWSLAKTRTPMPDVLEDLCTAAAQKQLNFDAHALAYTLWPMAKTGSQMPVVFEARCAEASRMVQHFHALRSCRPVS